MNSTTFTIESVHGVKQTFVLGPISKTAASGPAKPQPSNPKGKADGKGVSTGSRSPR